MTRNPDYDEWYRRCDELCIGLSGVGIEDLADGPSWDAWHDGVSPMDYVAERLEEEGFPFS